MSLSEKPITLYGRKGTVEATRQTATSGLTNSPSQNTFATGGRHVSRTGGFSNHPRANQPCKEATSNFPHEKAGCFRVVGAVVKSGGL